MGRAKAWSRTDSIAVGRTVYMACRKAKLKCQFPRADEAGSEGLGERKVEELDGDVDEKP